MRRVTSILRSVGLVEEFPVGGDDLAYYLQRGRMVHKVTELYDNGTIDPSSVDPRIQPYLEAWMKFRREVGGDVVVAEFEVSHPSMDYAGRLDRVIRGTSLSHKPLLFDIKTTAAPPWASVQTMAYALGYKATTGKRHLSRGAVALTSDGRWRFEPHNDDALDEAAWRAALTLDAWMRRNGTIKEDAHV